MGSWTPIELYMAVRWMSKEPAEIFERAAEDGFITQASGVMHGGKDVN